MLSQQDDIQAAWGRLRRRAADQDTPAAEMEPITPDPVRSTATDTFASEVWRQALLQAHVKALQPIFNALEAVRDKGAFVLHAGHFVIQRQQGIPQNDTRFGVRWVQHPSGHQLRTQGLPGFELGPPRIPWPVSVQIDHPTPLQISAMISPSSGESARYIVMIPEDHPFPDLLPPGGVAVFKHQEQLSATLRAILLRSITRWEPVDAKITGVETLPLTRFPDNPPAHAHINHATHIRELMGRLLFP